MNKNINRINNFDLIRLLAALQVVYMHSKNHLKIHGTVATFYDNFLQYFPGVPIFFTVSGFLIFWAFDRNQNIKQYAVNRFLRLYPALYICLAITVALLLFFTTKPILTNSSFYGWLVAQMSVAQFYTTDLLRFWGVGTPNGALWTIAVEVQYYVLVPIIFLLMRKIKTSIVIFALFALFALSIIANFVLSSMPENTLQKLSFVSIAPYLFNFLIGSVFYLYWDKIKNIVQNKFLIWAAIYLAYTMLVGNLLGFELHSYQMTNILHLLTTVLLSILTLSFAFSFNTLSDKILKHNDISYGIYIYHMLVINTLVSLDMRGQPTTFISVFVVTIVLAVMSWLIVEKPTLKLKSKIIAK